MAHVIVHVKARVAASRQRVITPPGCSVRRQRVQAQATMQEHAQARAHRPDRCPTASLPVPGYCAIRAHCGASRSSSCSRLPISLSFRMSLIGDRSSHSGERQPSAIRAECAILSAFPENSDARRLHFEAKRITRAACTPRPHCADVHQRLCSGRGTEPAARGAIRRAQRRAFRVERTVLETQCPLSSSLPLWCS
jgi:hypothetical protein